MAVSPPLLWPELGPAEVDEGWLADPGTGFRSADILAALEYRHTDIGWNGTPARWVFVREVQEQTGVYGDAQRFDAVAVGLVPSVKYARIIFEVKVSRADWLRELRPMAMVHDKWGDQRLQGKRATAVLANRDQLPAYAITERAKWESGLALSTEFYFAAPPRCILPSEVPEGTGLIEVRPWGPERQMRARTVIKAPVRDTPNPGPEFWAAVLRRAATRKPVSA